MNEFNFNGFSYFSRLDDRIESVLPSTLKIQDSTPTESILFRLLLGTIKFKHTNSEKTFEQKILYTKIRDTFEEYDGNNSLEEWINRNGDFGIIDLDLYFKKNKKNKNLFDELLTEFSYYFINKQNCNNISAFLHLYRALEYMSYSFPITYSSRVTGFYTSFDTFKDFFITKDQGQLKFFGQFVGVIFEKSLLRCRTTIDTFVDDNLLDKHKIKVIEKLCKDFVFYDDGTVITIEYKNLLDFMINLRNRYFHFQSDRNDNISNVNFNGELFFESLNDKFANWLSMIYLEILTQGVYKYNLLPLR